jgi:hypothetical protein
MFQGSAWYLLQAIYKERLRDAGAVTLSSAIRTVNHEIAPPVMNKL